MPAPTPNDIADQTLTALERDVKNKSMTIGSALARAFLAGSQFMAEQLRVNVERDVDAMFADREEKS